MEKHKSWICVAAACFLIVGAGIVYFSSMASASPPLEVTVSLQQSGVMPGEENRANFTISNPTADMYRGFNLIAFVPWNNTVGHWNASLVSVEGVNNPDQVTTEWEPSPGSIVPNYRGYTVKLETAGYPEDNPIPPGASVIIYVNITSKDITPTGSYNIFWQYITGDPYEFPSRVSFAYLVEAQPNNISVLSSGSVSPTTGNTSTTFTYSVNYTDADNDPPSFINVTIDGTSHAMNVRAGQDGDYTNGEIYEYTITGAALGIGSHTFQFNASDGIGYATGDIAVHPGPIILETALPNVELIYADPTVTSINVTRLNLSEVNETYKPAWVTSQLAYMINSTGVGNFTLRFTNIPNANAITAYKINTTNQWIPLDTTTTTSTVTFTMEVGDPPVVFGTMPDLSLSLTDISFSPASPTEGDSVSITAIIHNIGGADANNFIVSFFDGTSLIGTDTISINANSTSSASTTWTSVVGDRTIKVVADSGNVIIESYETNNEASKAITVKTKGVPGRRGGGGGGVPRDTDGDGYLDIDEMFAGTDPNDPNDYPGKPAATPIPTATPVVTPTPTMTPLPTPVTTPVATPTPLGKVPGFEAIFAISGLIAVTYLLRRKMK